jgi:3-dehydroquinate dehydratase-2
MSNEILLLSGPNLDLLGTRNPEIYGTTTLAEHVERFSELAKDAGFIVRHVQSNFEGDLIEAVHAARDGAAAIVINAGALTHSSWALADALDTFDGVKVEVHISNPAAREPFRHLSTLAGSVNGSVAGFGATSYELAMDAVRRLTSPTS